jgi:FkbM family methyltransferase
MSLLTQFYLRCSSRLAFLKRIPGLRGPLERMSNSWLRRDLLVWAKVQRGVGEGLWIQVSPRTGRVFLRGEVEPHIQRLLLEKLRPAATFYDLGSNFGFFTLLAARQVGPHGKVFAFDPESVLTARVRANAEKNGLGNVQVIQAAVWSSPGRVSFAPSDPRLSPDLGTGHIAVAAPDSPQNDVLAVSLDEFVTKNPPPDLIKCDVEGAEVEVFRGAKTLLATRKPTIICEIHSAENDGLLGDLLAGYGYQVRRIDSNHILAEGDRP